MKKQIHGGDIYSRNIRLDFSTNINPFGMPEGVKKAAIEGVEHSIHYPDVSCDRLKTAISDLENVPKDLIVCGNGAAELIFSLVLVKKPQKALLAVPGFLEYEQALRTSSCEISFYQMKKENGFTLQDDYLSMLTDDLDLVFLCSPNNPTGDLIEPKLLEKIIIKCTEKHIFLVLDECFQEFVEEEFQNSAKKYLQNRKNLFILKAFTKIYGMPGLRLGYGLCNDKELLGQMEGAVQPWNVSQPAQMAGIAACKEHAFVKKTREYISSERAFLKEELEKIGFRVYPSKANYLFFEAPVDLHERCLEEQILIRDCSNYCGLEQGYYRIAVRSHEENMEFLQMLNRKYK